MRPLGPLHHHTHDVEPRAIPIHPAPSLDPGHSSPTTGYFTVLKRRESPCGIEFLVSGFVLLVPNDRYYAVHIEDLSVIRAVRPAQMKQTRLG